MITPHEIEEKGFRMSFRGYNTDDVDDFLQEICDSYTEIYESNRKLKEKAGRLSDAVGQYKSMEDTLSDALNVAGKSADEIEEDANLKAAQIIRNAELTAQSIIDGAEQKISAEQYRYENIKKEIEIYKAKITELLNAQLCVLNGYPKSASIDNIDAYKEPNVLSPNDAVAEPNDKDLEESKNNISVQKPEYTEDADRETDNIISDVAKAEDENDFGQTVEFKSVENLDDDNKESAVDVQTEQSEDGLQYKSCDTENLPCVSMDENGGYTVHKKE